MFVCAECGASQPMPGHCGVDGSALAPVGDDLILGTTIGPYRVARLMGIGGMGRVYKGVHPQIGSRVAIKVLSRECSDRRDLVERFFAEAKAVNVIRHESIVNVLDLATLPDGRPYIVMEYLDGAPLAAIIADAQRSRQPLPIGGVARLAVEVLDALGAAHAKGIIHRDLKPDNIYVTPAGRAKVLDFGIAKLQPELGGSATHTGSLMGTPHYMSPEQAAGRSVDPRADLYAIGVILFECVTLQRPFYADALFDLLRKHIETPPPSPRALRPDMPDNLEQVIYAALAKQPEQRFATAQAMSAALQHATAQLPPEQWAPIQPSQANRPSAPGGWAPTPPASWARQGLPTSATPTPSKLPSPTPNPPTVPEPARPAPASKTGLWIGLSVLVAGGGIAAAVLATGGSPAPVSSQTGSGSGSSIAVVAVAADAGIAIVEVDAEPPAPPAEPPPVPAPADVAGSDELSPAQTAEMDAMVMQMLAGLPPEVLSPALTAALKKYGAWSKIPRAQRMKLLADVTAAAASGSLAFDMPGGPGDLANATKPAVKPVAPALPPSGKGPDGWVHNTDLALPFKIDPAKVDVQKLMTWAIREAKRIFPDAVLFRIDADGIGSSGLANITDPADSLDFRFITPSRKNEKECTFRIELEADGAELSPMGGFSCPKEALLGVPKCTLAEVWQRALALNAPANARAELGYRASRGQAKWYFDVVSPKWDKIFDDDCR